MTKKYVLKLTENQLKVIYPALESYLRLGIGQLENVIGDLSLTQYDNFGDKSHLMHSDAEFKEAIKLIKRKFFECEGLTASHGITSTKVHSDFKLIYEIHQKMRQFLALQREPNGGRSKDFDEPLKLTDEEYIELEVIEENIDGENKTD